MRSSFSRCGRMAFARGNSSWARNFNQQLKEARGYSSGCFSFPVAPSTWRMLSGCSPMMLNSLSVMAAAAESPVGTGFAEQPGCSQSGMLCSGPMSSDEVIESGDEVAEGLAAVPVTANVSLIKSLSDVIVFGTNCSNEMGKNSRI